MPDYVSAISTYGGQGVLKPGCKASEHTIVYLAGTQPNPLYGEREKGLTKDAIEIKPCEATELMQPTSRLRFGKIHSIEWNVKVRDIGQVSRKHMSKLLRYFKEEQGNGFDNDDDFSSEGESANAGTAAVQANYARVSYSTYATQQH
jgi:hypothetical protein